MIVLPDTEDSDGIFIRLDKTPESDGQTDRLMDRQTARGYYSSLHSGHAIKNYPKTKTNFFFWKTWIKFKTLIKLLLYELYYCYCN